MMNRILPSNEALVNFASLCLAITLNILSYTTLMFIACKIELPLAEDKRQNRIVLGLPIAISIFDIVCALFAPNLIFSANDINAFTPFFSTLLCLRGYGLQCLNQPEERLRPLLPGLELLSGLDDGLRLY